MGWFGMPGSSNEPNIIARTAAVAGYAYRSQLKLERHVKNLDPLIAWLDALEGQIGRGKTGDNNIAAYLLARGIDELLQRHTGARLTPSEKQSNPGKDLLTACFKLLGMEITAQAMIRRVAAARRGKVTLE
jgi:hypothetical protein